MGKPSEERKEEIIQAALELAAEQGIKNTSAQAIADRVGIAQPTIFRHFKTRDAIFQAAITWISERLFDVLGSVFAGKGPADERLRNLLRQQLAFMSRRRGLPRVLFSDRLHLEDPHLKAQVRAIMDGYTTRLAALLREGVAQGRFRADLDADEAAQVIAATVQGMLMRWSISDFAFPLETQGEVIFQYLWPALAP